ncbi:MAG: Asp23/Gls24 family envelope stress response protein [Clostridiales bacterium]|nr:Asp23/Gls24 family envelope stress response protein [Clostridiales bacterium]
MDEEKIVNESEPETAAECEPEENAEIGNIKISVDVVSTIAGIAAVQTNGVAEMYASFAGGIAEKFGAKKNPSKGVKVDMGEDSVKIDLYIVVEYGVRIPELSWEIQESVKNNVETMTGLEVEKVNIHIEGVSFKTEDEPSDNALQIEEPVRSHDEDEISD